MSKGDSSDKPVTNKRKKSLLEKYEISLSHLEFDYIENCSDVREIERIYRILSSGEEGDFPQLLQCAEERLKFLCPDHKTLVTCKPVLAKSQLNAKEWDSVDKEIMDWKLDIDATDNNLRKIKDASILSEDFYPEIRRPTEKVKNGNKQPDVPSKEKKISSTNYNEWDKFDADKECLKLDLEEEKRKEEKHRIELSKKLKQAQEAKISLEKKVILEIQEIANRLSPEERKVMSLKEKELGNEFYNNKYFKDALRHYTRAIHLHPFASNYNNRAAVYLKECKFIKALDDLNIVLKMEPDNIKAHFRRAICLQHEGDYKKALEDIHYIIARDPHHIHARHIETELLDLYNKHSKCLKLRTYDDDTNEAVNQSKQESKMKAAAKETNAQCPTMWSAGEQVCQHKLIQSIDLNENKNTTGVRRLEIVEVDKIDMVPCNVDTKPEEPKAITSCVVTDHRRDMAYKFSFDHYKNKKSNKKEEVSDGIDEDPKTKEEKMSLNTNLKESPGLRGTDDTSCMQSEKIVMRDVSSDDLGLTENCNTSKKNESCSREVVSQGELRREIILDINQIRISPRENIEFLSERIFPNETLSKCECGNGFIIWPSNFETKWAALQEIVNSLEERSKLFRLICPHRLSTVISNTLSEELLTGFIDCLQHHFDPISEREKIRDYLLSIANLQRFKIIYCFISTEYKQRAKLLLKNISPIPPHLERAFL